MGDLSPHFSRREFRCKCGRCSRDTVDVELLEILEHIRHHFDAPVIISSGNRCEARNARVGGAKASQHLYGRAADIKVAGVHPHSVARFLNAQYPNKLGVGMYQTFTHVDTRTTPVAIRWSS